MTHEQLAALGPAERTRVLDALEGGMSGRPNASIASNLRSYEEKFGMSTAEMLEKFAEGALPDDGEISAWLFWAGAARRTRVVR